MSHMKAFQPKLLVLEDDNIPMSVFKDLIIRRIFNTVGVPSQNHNASSTSLNQDFAESGAEKRPPPIPLEKVRIFSFTGVEIRDEDELSMIENNAYLFVSLGR